MIRRTSTKQVDSTQAGNYLEKARQFRADALSAFDLGTLFSTNGIAVLCVHAAIAYADALSIRAQGVKSISGDHSDAATVLQDSVRIASDRDKRALRDLRAILQRKDEVSCTAKLVRKEEAKRMMERLDGFAEWAESRYSGLM